jgi:hypothetical protein
VIAYRLEFHLPGLPPTPNHRQHWYVKAKSNREWRGAACLAAKAQKPARPLERAKVTYIRRSSRPLDADNLTASFKPVQDGLVDAGVLANDKWENIGFPTYLWEKAPMKQGGITVIVEEVSAEITNQAELKSGVPTDGQKEAQEARLQADR